MIFKILLILTCSLLMINVAVADELVVTTGFYANYKDTETGNEFTLLNDARIGYLWDISDIKIALLGITESDRVNKPNIADKKRNSLGLTTGLYFYDFYILGTWFFKSTLEGEARTKEAKGDGLRFDFGLNFSISKKIKAGPRITYRKYSYNDDTVGDGSFSSVEPTLALTILL